MPNSTSSSSHCRQCRAHPANPLFSCRHRTLPLVCRRWAELVNSPQLLHSISVSLACDNAEALPAFCGWLQARAAGHVQRLIMGLRSDTFYGALFDEDADEDDAHWPAALLFSTLRACGAGGQLRELRLATDSQLWVTSCELGPLVQSLQRLRLDREYDVPPLHLGAPGIELDCTKGLEQLEELWLCGGSVQATRLPLGLTHLHLHGCVDLNEPMRCLPQQACLVWLVAGAACVQPLGIWSCVQLPTVLTMTSAALPPPCSCRR